jgi:hypothetical protein
MTVRVLVGDALAPHRQPMLFPGEEAESIVLNLCAVLLGDPKQPNDRGLMSLIIGESRHLPTCGFGQWLTPGGPRPEGDPCSWRCLAAQDALTAAGRWLRDREAAG